MRGNFDTPLTGGKKEMLSRVLPYHAALQHESLTLNLKPGPILTPTLTLTLIITSSYHRLPAMVLFPPINAY